MARRITIEFLGKDRGVARTANQIESTTSRLGGKLKSVGKTMAIGLGLGVAAAGAAFVKFGVDSVQSLARIEKINAQTEAAIKSTGGAAGVTGKHVEGLAGRIESLTASEAEAVQEGANLLLTFTKIQNQAGRGNKIFDQATMVMNDMSVAMGTDMKSSAMLVGKALNDPIKGMSALSRAGVQFTEGQKDTIKSLVESGDTMKAQKVILKELETQFGGSGEAFAKTAQGKLELARHKFGELGEAIFTKLLPPLGDLASWLTNVGIPALGRMSAWINTNVLPALRSMGDWVQAHIIPIFKRFGTEGPSALDKLRAAVAPVVDAYRGLFAVLAPIIQQVAAVIRANWGPISAWARKTFGQVREIVSGAFKVIAAIVQRVTQVISAVWSRWGGDILAVASRYFRAVGQVISGALRVVQGVIKTVLSVIKGDWSGAWAGIKMILSGAWRAMKAIVSLAWDGIKAAVKAGIGKVVSDVKAFPSQAKAALGNLGSLLWGAGADLIQGLIDGIQSKIGAMTSKLGEITNMIPKFKGPRSKDKVLLKPAGVAIMEGLIKGIRSKEHDLQRVLGKVTDFVKRQGDKLKSLVSDRNSFASGFRSFSSSMFGADLGLEPNADGNMPTNQGLSALVAHQQEQKAKAQQLARDVNALVKKGLSKDLLRQLQASGESGIEQIRTLAGASSADITRINADNAATNRALQAAGGTAGNAIYGGDIREAQRAQALAKAIRNEMRTLLRETKEGITVQVTLDGRTMVASLKKEKRRRGGAALGIG